MTPDVELVYDADCPNVSQARAQLLRAFAAAGLPARWREWCSTDPALPKRARGLGSPSILVGGRDVLPLDNTASCCRVYMGADGLAAVPPLDTLVRAIGADGAPGAGWKSAGLWGPGVGIAFLPKLICPACWPAYSALVSAAGLPFLFETRFLLPVTLAALALIVAVLAWRANARRGYGPMALALAAGAVLIAGKFVYSNDWAAYTGATALLAACVWNIWPRRERPAVACPACAPGPSS